jgi:excisionase family DNA binding protein
MTSRQTVPLVARPDCRRLASRGEVAAYLGVPLGTLDRWAHHKTGPPYKIVGKHARYAWPDVDRWLAEQESGGGPA